ncbi:MAG: class I SAM-dependent methyltransferase [Terriglobia bacterium]
MHHKHPSESNPGFLPAMSGKYGLHLYDPLIRVTLREYSFKRRLIHHAQLSPQVRVLDAGCGTGTLLSLVEASCPGARLAGIDPDDRILRRACAKTSTPLSRATAARLPFPAGAFDCVFATLVFHHLLPEEKSQAFGEILRVLRPGGWLHAADFGKPRNWLMRVMGKLVQMEDGEERTRECFTGLVPALLRRSGFRPVQEWEHRTTLFGTLVLFSAQKPE